MTIILFCLIQSCIVIQSLGLVRRSSSSRIRADVSLRSSRNTVVDKGTCLPSMSRRSEGNQRLFFLVAASVKGHSQLNTFPMVHLCLRLKPACGSAEWRKSHRRNQRGRKESGTLFNIKTVNQSDQGVRRSVRRQETWLGGGLIHGRHAPALLLLKTALQHNCNQENASQRRRRAFSRFTR